MSTQRVLFLCTGNSARSQMAEAFLRKFGGNMFEPHSAGLEPKGVNPLTIKVMNEVGIDISNQQSKGIDTYLGKVLFQYLITYVMMPTRTVPPFGPASTRACTGRLKTRRDLKAQSKKSLLNSARYAI